MLPLNQVSLIIPTYNRQEIVFQTLQYITGQSISGFEVIIVDQTIEKDSNLENFKNDIFDKRLHLGLPSWFKQ